MQEKEYGMRMRRNGAGSQTPPGGYKPWLIIAAGTAIAASKSKEGAAVYALASLISIGYQANSFNLKKKLEGALDGDHGKPTSYLKMALQSAAYAATISYIMPIVAQGLTKYSNSTALCSIAAFVIANGVFSNLPASIVTNNKGESFAKQTADCLMKAAFVNIFVIALPSLLRPKFGRGAEFAIAVGFGLLGCVFGSKEEGANAALKFGAAFTIHNLAFSSMPSMFSGAEVNLSSFGKLAVANFLGEVIINKVPNLF